MKRREMITDSDKYVSFIGDGASPAEKPGFEPAIDVLDHGKLSGTAMKPIGSRTEANQQVLVQPDGEKKVLGSAIVIWGLAVQKL